MTAVFQKNLFYHLIWMIKPKQVLFWTSNLKNGTVSMVTKLPFCIWPQNIIHCLCCLKNLIFLTFIRSSTSKVMVILMYGAENVEFKFFPLKRHLRRPANPKINMILTAKIWVIFKITKFKQWVILLLDMIWLRFNEIRLFHSNVTHVVYTNYKTLIPTLTR